jgi:LysM repeat protein
MSEPLKQPTSLSDTEPRTARARSERDIGGRSKRPPRGERSSRKQTRATGQAESRPAAKSDAGARTQPRTEARPKSGGSSSRPSRPSRSRSGSPQRPRDVKAGSGARILAPLALIVFAIACFAVVSSNSSSTKTPDKAAATKAAAATAAAKSGPTRSTYRVKSGDSFSAIAVSQGIDVDKLQALNKDVDPRTIQPGQKLKLK